MSAHLTLHIERKEEAKQQQEIPYRGLKFISRQQEQISICSLAAERLGNTHFSLIASIGEKGKWVGGRLSAE